MTKPFALLISCGFFSILYPLNTPIAVPFRGGRRRRFQKEREPQHKINEKIRAKSVRVVTDDGEMLGVLSIDEALSAARSRELDLVEISPKADPPVCKIIDYGKYLYEQKKKEKLQKKASKGHEMKGIRLSFRIGPGDLDRQRKHAEEFLSTGHPIRVQMVMRGREKAHKDLALEKMKAFLASLEEFGTVDNAPRAAGFQIVSIMKPKTGKKN